MDVKFGTRTYHKTKFDDLFGETRVSFVEASDLPNPFTIVCTKSGFTFSGEFFRTASTLGEAEEILVELRAILQTSWHERLALKPKIVATLSGH